MVQDIDWDQEVVIVNLALVLARYYGWSLVFGLL